MRHKVSDFHSSNELSFLGIGSVPENWVKDNFRKCVPTALVLGFSFNLILFMTISPGFR